MKHHIMGLYFQEEIVINILKRLPVKSLTRFQCVCKDWQTLIQTSSFIHEHLQHSTLQPSLVLVVNGILPLPTSSLLTQRLRLLDCDMQVRGFPQAPLIDSLTTASILGSCNGIFLVQTNEFENEYCPFCLLLWNPATASVKHVPMTPTDDVCLFDGFITAFGFSPTLNEYTIIRTTAAEYPDCKVKVFSFRRGSWKEVDAENLKGVKLSFHAVTLGGAMYWTGIKFVFLDEIEVIVSYDIVKEEFTLIPSPESQGRQAMDYLTIYENKVAVLRNIEEVDCSVEMWVLVDDGSSASGKTWNWIKRYSGNPFPGTLDPLAFWRNDIVRIRHYENVLDLVNLTTNEVKNFVYPSIIKYCYNYVESLISVDNI